MLDPKDKYFEFMSHDEYVVVLDRTRIIGIEQRYPDKLDFPDANKYKTRAVVTVAISDTESREIEATEKMKTLLRRLYDRPFSGI